MLVNSSRSRPLLRARPAALRRQLCSAGGVGAPAAGIPASPSRTVSVRAGGDRTARLLHRSYLLCMANSLIHTLVLPMYDPRPVEGCSSSGAGRRTLRSTRVPRSACSSVPARHSSARCAGSGMRAASSLRAARSSCPQRPQGSAGRDWLSPAAVSAEPQRFLLTQQTGAMRQPPATPPCCGGAARPNGTRRLILTFLPCINQNSYTPGHRPPAYLPWLQGQIPAQPKIQHLYICLFGGLQ